MKTILILYIIISVNLFAANQADSIRIERGRRYLCLHDSTNYPVSRDTITFKRHRIPFEEALPYYVYDSEIQSPLSNTKFYIYRITTSNPNAYYVVASYSDTYRIIIKWWCDGHYGCNSLINFINERLKDEQPLNYKRLYNLVLSLDNISSPAYITTQIITYNNGEWWGGEKKGTLRNYPDNVLNKLRPLSIEIDENNILIKYFVCTFYENIEVSNIGQVNLLYRDNQIWFEYKDMVDASIKQ